MAALDPNAHLEALLAPEAPVVVPNVAIIRTYSQLFTDALNDPYNREYADIMAVFRTTNNPTGGADLLVQTAQSDVHSAGNFIGMFEAEGFECGRSIMISCIHRYPAALGRPTVWDGRNFAFADDVIDGDIMTVHVPPEAFNLTRGAISTNVPATIERVDELLIENPDDQLLGPFLAADANIRQTRTRVFAFVPPRYVPIVAARRLTPRQLWLELVGAIRGNGDENTCGELVNWVVHALTRQNPGAPSSVRRPPLLVPLADASLRAHRRSLLHTQLPGLATPVQVEAAAATTALLANFVGQLVDEQRQSRLDQKARAEESRAPKTPTAYWGESGCAMLCAMCDVEFEDLLPNLWIRLASAGKRDRIAIEQSLLDAARSVGNVDGGPSATPELTKKLVSLRFGGDNIDDLSEGIQPFSLTLQDEIWGGSEAADARARNSAYDIMAGGSVTTSFEDAKTLRGTGKIRLPSGMMHVKALLQAQDILFRAMLGQHHPMTVSFHALLSGFSNRELFYRARLDAIPQSNIPSRFLRYVQLRIVTWFRDHRDGAAPPVPVFTTLLTQLGNCETAWIPDIPQQYLLEPKLPAITSELSIISAGGTSTTSNASSLSSSSGTGTTIPRTAPAVANNKRNAIFEPHLEALGKKKLNDLIRKIGPPPPITRTGLKYPMCATYHLRGTCFSNCSRNKDHGPHTTEEDAKLLEWCIKALE
jgi:hypothetical protein